MVKKRTPRVPVYKKDERDNHFPSNMRELKAETATSNDDVEHVALALSHGLHRVGSPQVSGSPYSRKELGKSSPVKSRGKMVLICVYVLFLHLYIFYTLDACVLFQNWIKLYALFPCEIGSTS